MTTNQPRKPGGTPVGGQYDTTTGGGAAASLDAAESGAVWEETHVAGTSAVGDVLGLPVLDDGGGAYLRVVDRSAERKNDVVAFVPHLGDQAAEDPSTTYWRVQDGETGQVTVLTGLTVDADRRRSPAPSRRADGSRSPLPRTACGLTRSPLAPRMERA